MKIWHYLFHYSSRGLLGYSAPWGKECMYPTTCFAIQWVMSGAQWCKGMSRNDICHLQSDALSWRDIILFLLLLLRVDARNNLVFASPFISQFILDLVFQNPSSLLRIIEYYSGSWLSRCQRKELKGVGTRPLDAPQPCQYVFLFMKNIIKNQSISDSDFSLESGGSLMQVTITLIGMLYHIGEGSVTVPYGF